MKKVSVSIPDKILEEIENSAKISLRTMNAELVLLLMKALGFSLKPQEVAKILAESDAYQMQGVPPVNINEIPFKNQESGLNSEESKIIEMQPNNNKDVKSTGSSKGVGIPELIEKIGHVTGNKKINDTPSNISEVVNKVHKVTQKQIPQEQELIEDIIESKGEENKNNVEEKKPKYKSLLDFVLNSPDSDDNSIQRMKAILQSYLKEHREIAERIINSIEYSEENIKQSLRSTVNLIEQELSKEQTKSEEEDQDKRNSNEQEENDITSLLSEVTMGKKGKGDMKESQEPQKIESSEEVVEVEEPEEPEDEEEVIITPPTKKKKKKRDAEAEIASVLNLLNKPG